MTSLSYKDAGVDLEQYGQAMLKLPALMAKTHGPRVLPLEGGFAGLFQLQGAGRRYEDPVLVSGTDGVGTKIRVAQLAQRFDTIGIDLVAMCVNDCLCVGAEPLFFLDYLALAKDDTQLVIDLVRGVSEGCLQAGAALLGGETAVMPGLYAPGDFDLAGFCVGVVERTRVIDGSQIQPGDVLLGVPSTGLHSNGFSLVRKAVFEAGGLNIDDDVPHLGGTVADVLLTPTRIYSGVVATLLADESVSECVAGIAHITGGGLDENVSRILPPGCRLSIDRNAWQAPAVFDWVRKLGNIDHEEMFRVFNMGIGLVFVVRSASAGAAGELLKDEGAVVIGEVVKQD
jgi:phosphoribosylformylglycinamidine cyclo-ligase